MHAWIYKGNRKDKTYLYIGQKDNFDPVPQPLLDLLGSLSLVLDIDLHPGRRLAQADAKEVIRQLAEVGFYLQMPPEEDEFSGKPC